MASPLPIPPDDQALGKEEDKRILGAAQKLADHSLNITVRLLRLSKQKDIIAMATGFIYELWTMAFCTPNACAETLAARRIVMTGQLRCTIVLQSATIRVGPTQVNLP